MQSQADRDARIRDRAYQIWLSEGRRHGHDEAHWQQAQREIEAEEAAAPGATKASARFTQSRTTVPVTSEADPPTVSRARAKNDTAARKPRTRAAAAANADPEPVTSEGPKPASRSRRGAKTYY
jgi:hypothetical protein